MLLLLVYAAIIVIAFAVLVYAGFVEWFNVKVAETTEAPVDRMLVVYRPHVGEYKNTWIALREVQLLLAATGKSDSRLFGIYYDDPANGKNRCRYIVGAILAEGSTVDKLYLEGNDVSAHFKHNGFKMAVFPKVERCLYATFPFRAGCLSILLAVSSVYKVLNKAIKKTGVREGDRGIMEVYDTDVMHYVFHLDEPADKLMASEFKSKDN